MVSYEDKRIQGFVNHIAKKLGMNWYVWNEVNGLSRFDFRTKKFAPDKYILELEQII